MLEHLIIADPLGVPELIFAELLLPLHVVLLHTPYMAADVYIMTPLVHVVKILRNLPNVNTLLLDLTCKYITLSWIYYCSSLWQASRSFYEASHCPPGKTTLSTY